MRHSVAVAATILALAAGSAWAIESNSIIVTADAPPLSGHDVFARAGNQPATITSWRPLRGNPAGLELWILIDDGTDSRVGTQIGDIKDFIRQQPPETRVGVGYMQNGRVLVLAKPTIDHEAAVKAIRLPNAIPGISASPYIALSDFLHKLPKAPEQPREIVLVSSGIDPYYGPGPLNPYLLSAIEDAQKAGVPVHTIYFSSAGRVGHRLRQIDWGQNDLSELSEETGGQFYWQGISNPVAFKPFFDDLNHKFTEQYIVRLDTSSSRSGPQRLQLHTEPQKVKITGPSQIYAQ